MSADVVKLFHRPRGHVEVVSAGGKYEVWHATEFWDSVGTMSKHDDPADAEIEAERLAHEIGARYERRTRGGAA